jgi:hypothetical protein
MLYALEPLMIEYETRYYVQTFLSGTATQGVTNGRKYVIKDHTKMSRKN